MTQLQELVAIVGQLLPLIPDEEQREALEQKLEQAANDYPGPEEEPQAGAITQAKVSRLQTAIKLLSDISADTKLEEADKAIKQAVVVLKAFRSDDFVKPETNIEYPGEDWSHQIDESWKGKSSERRIEGRLLEAIPGTKNRFKICIVESGKSLNEIIYPLDVLSRRAEYYNNKPMYIDHTLQEQRQAEGGVPSLKGDVSTVVNAHVDEKYVCSNGSIGALLGEAVIHNQDWLKEVQVPEFRQRLGISHVVQAKMREEASNGNTVRIAEDIMPEHVDWVSQEGAGGRVLESRNKKQGVNRMPEGERIDEGMKREVRRLRAKDEARDLLTLSEALDPQTKAEIIQEVADIAEKSDEPIDVKTITEAIRTRYEGAIDRATKKDSPIMPGAAGRPASGPADMLKKASSALGTALYGHGEKTV